MYTAANKDEHVQNMKSSAQSFKDNATDIAHDTARDLRAVANRAGRQVRGFVDDTTRRITDASETVASQVSENPLQSTFIALGIGFLLGSLFRR